MHSVHLRKTGRRRLASLMALLLICGAGAASAAEKPAKPPKLFSSVDTLEVTLAAPWRDVERKKTYQGTYPAKLSYQNPAGETVTLQATVARRGITRQRVCRYPPIRLGFDKEGVKGTMFRGQKSLKLVTHCDKSSRYEQYYVLEMLAYRMYNLLTDYSFRVRPLAIVYEDSERGKTGETQFAFLIEDDKDVAKRNDLKKLNIPRISASRLDPEVTSLFSLFQYMIGNVDWAALSGPDPEKCCHNVKLIGPEPLQADDLAIPVPYDFDSSGLVDAEYAAPPNGLPIRTVTQRLFRGYCIHNPTLESARRQILGQEQAILQLLVDEKRLASSSRKKATRYLKRFFSLAKDSKDFEKAVIERCRK